MMSIKTVGRLRTQDDCDIENGPCDNSDDDDAEDDRAMEEEEEERARRLVETQAQQRSMRSRRIVLSDTESDEGE